MKQHVETEAKLSAWPGLTLPDLSGIREGVVSSRLAEQVLEATYFDTADLRLARAGVTMRHRTGEGSGGPGLWTVKLPDGQTSSSGAMVRREVSVEAPPSAMPAEVSSLVRALTRSAPVAPVATLITRRRRIQLADSAGKPLAEIDDDEVSVRHGRRVAERFREIEVEVNPHRHAEDLLAAVCERLVSAGAVASPPIPKVIRALGPAAMPDQSAALPSLPESPTMTEVVGRSIASGLQRLVRHDPGVRLGNDAEDVHQARVATRRLRSDLRTFSSLVDREAAEAIGSELKWLGAILGEVRDNDVLAERFRRQVQLLSPADRAPAGALIRRLRSSAARSRAALLEALDSPRYEALLDALDSAAETPPMADGKGAVDARSALPRIVRVPWRRLDRHVGSLGDEPPDEALHEARIRAKRARYAAEAAEPVMGKATGRLAKALSGLQGVLGDLQDAVVAEDWLRAAAQRATPEAALVAGQLLALQQREADAARREWPRAWAECRRVAGKPQRSWLR